MRGRREGGGGGGGQKRLLKIDIEKEKEREREREREREDGEKGVQNHPSPRYIVLDGNYQKGKNRQILKNVYFYFFFPNHPILFLVKTQKIFPSSLLH